MISVDEATQLVMSTAKGYGIEQINLSEGIGRVLMEDWHCDRDLPPYDRVTMDGIALNYAGSLGQETIAVAGVVAAGDPSTRLDDVSQCLEVMTGAMLPDGTDTVIRYEDIEIVDGRAKINASYAQNQNIHWQGEDRKQGDLLVPAGTQLSASEIGVGASIGKSVIKVSRLPKTIVISTGNELVEVNETPKPHQIRRGNVYRIQATLSHLGISCDTAHINDDKEQTIEKLLSILQSYDLIIMSGGVSKGKFDYLPGALATCGVEKLFHKVAQRPGKPLWFGVHPDGATVFALPGNPVSSFMCLMTYGINWIKKSSGLTPNVNPVAILNEDVHFKPDLTYFLEVKMSNGEDGKVYAKPARGNGSGDLANLLNGDAFIRLPQGRDHFKKGEIFRIYNYR